MFDSTNTLDYPAKALLECKVNKLMIQNKTRTDKLSIDVIALPTYDRDECIDYNQVFAEIWCYNNGNRTWSVGDHIIMKSSNGAEVAWGKVYTYLKTTPQNTIDESKEVFTAELELNKLKTRLKLDNDTLKIETYSLEIPQEESEEAHKRYQNVAETWTFKTGKNQGKTVIKNTLLLKDVDGKTIRIVDDGKRNNRMVEEPKRAN